MNSKTPSGQSRTPDRPNPEEGTGAAGSTPPLQRILQLAVRTTGADAGLIVSLEPARILAQVGLDGEPARAQALAARAIAGAGGRGGPVSPEAGAFIAAQIRPDDGVPGGVMALTGERLDPKDAELDASVTDFAALAGAAMWCEAQVRRAEEERVALLAELEHRVKNVLAACQSVAAQSARKALSLDGFLKAFGGRIRAMASAQELLTASRWRGADLHNLAAAELNGLAPGQTRWEGPSLLLNNRIANTVSLLLHELAINAVRHGSLTIPSGRVDLTWRRGADDSLELDWIESGGPPVKPPARRGFGITLLEDIAGREMGGVVRTEFLAGGLRVCLRSGPGAVAAEPQAAATPEPVDLVSSGASAGPPPNRGRDVRGMKVLIVEDAVLLAWELEVGLTEAGVEVVGSAAEVEEAMALIEQPLDAAVLDANLNGASVRPVAEALQAREVPFFFATGYGENRGAPEGFDVPVIRKPYDITQILAALADIRKPS